MAIKRIELEVDVIGGEGSLTAAEEKALSDFFKLRKEAKGKTLKPKMLLKNPSSIIRQGEVLA
jgi:hypothetical protein